MASDKPELGVIFQSLKRGESTSDIREQLLRKLTDAVEFDAAVYFRLAGQVVFDDADYHYTGVHAVGGSALVERLHSYDGKPLTCDAWDPVHPEVDSIGQFLPSRLVRRDADRISGKVFEDFSEHDVKSAVRMLVYDDRDAFAGGIIGLRRDDAGFDPNEMRTLRTLQSDVRDILIGLQRRRQSRPAGGSGHILFRHDSEPTLEAFSQGADVWLSDERRRRLERWVDYADSDVPGNEQTHPVLHQISSDPARWAGLLDGYSVCITPMHGTAGKKLLAAVRPADSPKMGPLATLTPRQREVARKAASGMTNREIADALQITPDTVGDHLSAIYDRLELANRVELANRISE